MSRSAFIYKGNPASGLLTILLLGFWLMKALHPLLEHHHSHEDHPVCTAAERDRSEHHLHDERYAADECSLCAFVLSVQECTPPLSGLVLSNTPPDSERVLPTPANCLLSADDHVTCLRGPPCC